MRPNEKLLLEAIQQGYKSTPQISKHLGKTPHWVCKYGKVLEELGLVYIDKIISKPNVYREVNENGLPAHDPFNLCGLRRALRATKTTEPQILPSQTSAGLGERRKHRLEDSADSIGHGNSHQRIACVEYGKPTELRDII